LLKVLVTGAFSTGKSSLIEGLASKIRERCSVVVIPDVARQCPFTLNREQEEDGTLWLMTKQILNELEASRNAPDIILCDRGVPDILAHLEEARVRGVAGRRPDLLKPFLIEWCRTYQLVLVSKIDPRIPIIRDDFRVPDHGFRAEMETFSDTILAKFTPHASTLSLCPGKRISESLELIERELRRSDA
jgi:nicotinamide riboside kinase